MNIQSSKTLGGIGATLIFAGVIGFFANPFVSAISLVGAIFLLAALNGLANILNDTNIFSNALYGFIVAFVGGIVAASAMFVVILNNLADLFRVFYPSWDGDWSTIPSLQGLTPNMNVAWTDIAPLISGFLIVAVIVWVAAIIAAFFMRRSLNRLSIKSNHALFSTAGILLLIGAFLTIVLVGLVLMWIAVLILAIAFFTMKPQLQATVPASPAPL